MIGLYLCVLVIIIFDNLISFSLPFETTVLNSSLKKGTLLDHAITTRNTAVIICYTLKYEPRNAYSLWFSGWLY